MLLVSHFNVLASPISQEKAYSAALKWFSQNNRNAARVIGNNKLCEKKLEDKLSAIYMFTHMDQAFVIIGGSNEHPVVLGYGDKCEGKMPENMTNMLLKVNRNKLLEEETTGFLNGYRTYKHDATKVVLPFIKTIRDQEAPFNNACPYYKDSEGNISKERCIVGCLATALEQIISYHNYPEMLKDTLKGWTTKHYKVDTILPGTKINFNKILDEYTPGSYTNEEAQAVADLCYYCGIASNMDWGLSSSGANVENTTDNLRKAFGYQYVRHVYSCEYSIENWHKLLYEELANQRPILFAGYTTGIGGHAFVIDGVNSEGFYHILWGYKHNYNGYFDLSILNMCENPKESTHNGELWGYYSNQEALLLNPEPVEDAFNETLVQKHRIMIDSVRFTRNPDVNRYVTGKIYVRNVSDDEVASSILLSTFAPGDTTMQQTLENIALAGKVLEPHSSACLDAYCWFHSYGPRILTAFTDDSAYVYFDTINVIPTEMPILEQNIASIQPTDNMLVMKINYSNTSEYYWAGNLMIYCLFEGEESSENWGSQHYTVLNIPPLGNFADSISFSDLKPSTKYTLVVKNNWVNKLCITFETLPASGIHEAKLPTNNHEKEKVYDLQGQTLTVKPQKGIVIIEKNRKREKHIIR